MINRVIEWSAAHRAAVVLAALAAAAAGWWSMQRVPLDAIPDLGDTQVIVYSRWDRSPDLIEDQVTYPIVTALARRAAGQGGARLLRLRLSPSSTSSSRTAPTSTGRARGRSSTSRQLLPRLPEGVTTELGPDATGVGWVFQYALVDDSGTHSLAELRSMQDWYLRYHLKSVPGVAEVASLGGFVRQYQVNVDPNRLRAYGLADQQGRGGGAQRQQRSRRAADRVRRHRVHGARPRLRPLARPTSRTSSCRRTSSGDAGPRQGRRPSRARPRHPPRRRRPRRPGRRRRRASSSCARARTRST